MQEETEKKTEGMNQDSNEEGLFEPRSKYERIVLAAAEATRLNEEIHRKGIRVDHKVTLEALKRVDEGKVKGQLPPKSLPFEPPPPAKPEIPKKSLFASPSYDSEQEGDAEGEDNGDKPKKD